MFRHLCIVAFFLLSQNTVWAAAESSYQTFLRPYKVSQVVSPQRNTLTRVDVTEGDRVVAGQLLAKADNLVLQARLSLARQAAESDGAVKSARLLVELRESKLASLKRLEQRGTAKPQEIEAARTSVEMAKAQLQLAVEEQKLKQAESEVIRAQLKETEIVSPFDGTVVQVHKNEGELVGGQPGDPVFTIVQLDPLLADFHLSPDGARSLKTGAQVQVSTDSGMVEGEITFISPIINAQSNTVLVRITLPNESGALVSGSRATYNLSNILESNTDEQGDPAKADQGTL